MISYQELITPSQMERPMNWLKHFRNQNPIELEIGFGNGEFLVSTAKENPNKNFVGIELHWKRIQNSLRYLTRMNQKVNPEKRIDNIRLLYTDAYVALERMFLPSSIDQIYSLFPCPWPKNRHERFRLFSHDFLRLTNSRLTNKGKVLIVTDFYPYLSWIVQQIPHAGFTAQTRTVKPRYATKYERKWYDQGQKEFFELELLKERHIDVPWKQDVVMKVYFVDQFDPAYFRFLSETGDCAIIFKDFIFDSDRRKGMVHLIVSEQNEHLTQHFWVAIVKDQNRWCLGPAEGIGVIPTSGIARSLELVYQAAKNSVKT